MEIAGLVDHFFRTEYGKAVSHLTSKFGSANLELAEDCVQESLFKAMQTWPYSSVPDNPTGWIIRVANNKMIDLLRREQKSSSDTIPDSGHETEDPFFSHLLNDDMVRMLFACCHPSISSEYQIILTLKILGGLSIREIAMSLLKKEETVAKGYTRAKKKFKTDEIRLTLPSANQIEERLDRVLRIIYLLFNEGYKSTEGDLLIRDDLCLEAIRLCRVLIDNELCNTPSTNALMALMHFHVSRFEARTDENGEILSLEEQDRSRWNQEIIQNGIRHLQVAAESNLLNEYIIQATINSFHCMASNFEETNWSEILKLYDWQLQLTPSPIVRLNRVVAMEKVLGSSLALIEVNELEDSHFFDEYYLFYAIKAEVLKNLGETDGCKIALSKATSLAKNTKEINYLNKKLNELLK